MPGGGRAPKGGSFAANVPPTSTHKMGQASATCTTAAAATTNVLLPSDDVQWLANATSLMAPILQKLLLVGGKDMKKLQDGQSAHA